MVILYLFYFKYLPVRSLWVSSDQPCAALPRLSKMELPGSQLQEETNQGRFLLQQILPKYWETKKYIILPTTLYFTVRRGKLRIYTLQNTPKIFWKSWGPHGMCCGMFCLDGEVIFIHSKHVKQIGSSPLILFVTCG